MAASAQAVTRRTVDSPRKRIWPAPSWSLRAANRESAAAVLGLFYVIDLDGSDLRDPQQAIGGEGDQCGVPKAARDAGELAGVDSQWSPRTPRTGPRTADLGAEPPGRAAEDTRRGSLAWNRARAAGRAGTWGGLPIRPESRPAAGGVKVAGSAHLF